MQLQHFELSLIGVGHWMGDEQGPPRCAEGLCLSSGAQFSRESHLFVISNKPLTYCQLRIRAISQVEMQFNCMVPVRWTLLANCTIQLRIASSFLITSALLCLGSNPVLLRNSRIGVHRSEFWRKFVQNPRKSAWLNRYPQCNVTPLISWW